MRNPETSWLAQASRLAALQMLFALSGHGMAQEIEPLRQAVVKIVANVDGKEKTGAGFVFRADANEVLIVTAAHVVEGDPHPRITYLHGSAEPASAEIRKMEGGDDRGLAVIAVRSGTRPANLRPLVIDTSRLAQVADAAIAIGFPEGGGEWSVTNGTVAGRDGRIVIFSGSVAQGNSGGPLLRQGKVIGVMVQERRGFGYAVSSEVLQATLSGWGFSDKDDCVARVSTAGTSKPSWPRIPDEATKRAAEADQLLDQKKYAEAARLLRAASELGHFESTYLLAVAHWYGRGVDKSETEALRLFQRACDAAQLGNPDAQSAVGMAYDLPAPWLSDDASMRFQWFKLAADQGSSIAQAKIGLAYLNGKGTPQDYGEAARWIRKAAEAGEIMSQYNLGRLYSTGTGVARDDALAFSWYRKAAERGLVAAEVQLALAYLNGKGTAKDFKQAAVWLTRTANWGDAQSQYLLGLMYSSGDGVPRNESLALDLWRRSARQKYQPAMSALQARGLRW